MPLTLDVLMAICKRTACRSIGSTEEARDRPAGGRRVDQVPFEAPGTVLVNRRLRQPGRALKYGARVFHRHKVHNGDGAISPHSAMHSGTARHRVPPPAWGRRTCCMRGRDFDAVSSRALYYARHTVRRFLIREAHSVRPPQVGVTAALVMRRMTAVSPYRHWHFFDAYPPASARGLSRQRNPSALGQHEFGVGSMPALGGVSAC